MTLCRLSVRQQRRLGLYGRRARIYVRRERSARETIVKSGAGPPAVVF